MLLICVNILSIILCFYFAEGRTSVTSDINSRDAERIQHEDHAVVVPITTFRLVGRRRNGPTREGRLEVWHRGVWGTVCDDLFGVAEANLACTIMGFQHGGEPIPSSRISPGQGPIHLHMLDCPWGATSLGQCSHQGWGRHRCNHSEDVGILCRLESPPVLPIRLHGGRNANEGRLQVLKEGIWGTVFNNNWDPRDAAVVCRQLGFSNGGGALMWRQYEFGVRPEGPVWFHNLNCAGKEPSIEYCSPLQNYEGPTQPTRDVSVRCYTQPIEDFQVRLNGGSDNSSGIVNIYHDGRWWNVCDNWWWDDDATVTCKSLGFSGGTATRRQFDRSYPHLSFGWDMVYCPTGSTELQQCFHRGWGTHTCYFWEVAGVICQ